MFTGGKTEGSDRFSQPGNRVKSSGFSLILAVLSASALLPAAQVLAEDLRPPVLAEAEAEAVEGLGPGKSAAAADVAVAAEESARIMALFDSMGLPQLLPILSEEGQSYGDSLGASTFPGRAGSSWAAAVARIYDAATLEADLAGGMFRALAGQEEAVAAAQSFFASSLGQKVVAAEVAARRLLLDPAETEAAEVEVVKLRDARSPRLRLYRALIEAGDQVENNVANGLSGALAFEQGLAESEPAEQRRDADHMAEQVWAQEGGYRASTGAWAMTYAALAYADLTDAEVKAYTDFVASPGGRAVSTALFSAFGESFRKILHDLGREAGLVLRGHQI